jgi:hypothetical protein
MKNPLKHIPRPMSAYTQCGEPVQDQDPKATEPCPTCLDAYEAAQAKFGGIHRNLVGSPARTCVSFRGGVR